ncbi:NAD(P)H-dependent glycerol-3-phosphate dehydrogenase [Paramaledivibacter caminithermalis]|jgi:glycerol-3-phosphate dehydrogenase (NAD(P)+)|uniref:Glycerol-3-phosphate dehydrogenase [NAD(P)+] n=1 Tax=Paramaledivibacter caminithermalis (strain DSM 15212 / CIP 107654 / DViRD3) TaxID=1121301 RepID=A0A1M6S3K1_PARC5|nr:NAD(P)H-dependent glycerol-3-phosphate dehydrogenase [Paramaledivibacter caminithermalis]SHK39323.1 glycerol 3-phosphate dehydrogenase (NAD(P)+) [Paramaledivibacter caminithermalis DSM 15212]
MKGKIGVLGAGSWGTALSIVLADKGHSVNLWGRNQEHIESLRCTRENSKYLPNAVLSQNINMYTDICDCIKGCSIIVLAVSSQGIRETLEKIKGYVSKEQIFVNVSKGIENNSLLRISQIVNDYYPDNHYVALSGPSHAEEVCKGIPTTIVSASKSRYAAEYVQDIFITNKLRVYTNPDVVGVELGGSLKNVIALGAGISDGLGYGDNAKAALMTRGIREIARLGEAMGANISTFAGLTGIGDLIVTCTSMHSRNRRCGIQLGQGKSLKEAVASIGMVVEGVYTTKAAYELSKKFKIEMPITNEIYKILYDGCSAKESVSNLMLRSKTHEIEEVMEDFIDSW